MSDLPTPDAIANAIEKLSEKIDDSVEVCHERYKTYLEADHRYDVAFAQAYLDHDGPAHVKKHAAVLATQAERHERDVADAAYRYADRRARSFESDLRGLQSRGASVRAIWSATGTGVGA